MHADVVIIHVNEDSLFLSNHWLMKKHKCIGLMAPDIQKSEGLA